ALDAVFEVLVRAGRTAPLAKTILVPEAWSKKASTMPDSHRAMYAYANAVMEPWDGPAALAATDGRWVIAGMDRNGLRPQRYAVTEDGLLFVGSETGMVVLNESRVIRKGRVGPGQMIALDLEEGRFYEDRAIKDKLAGEYPYEEWTKNIVELEPIIARRRTAHLRQGTIAQAPDRGGFQHRGSRTDPPLDGGRRQGSHRLHGRRHAARGALREIPPAVALFPAEFQPGHQSADRPVARGTGDESENALPQSRQRACTGRKPDRSVRAGTPGVVHRHVPAPEAASRRTFFRDQLRLRSSRRKAEGRRSRPRLGPNPRRSRRRGTPGLQPPDPHRRTHKLGH